MNEDYQDQQDSYFTNPNSRPCNCGSGKERYGLHDARNIFCGYVCEDCEEKVKSKYRPEIFNSAYDAEEAIEDDY